MINENEFLETASELPELIPEALLHYLSIDSDREGLKGTPNRFIDAWDFWTQGYHQDPKEVLKSFEDGSEQYDEMVFQGNISFWSTCEHHLAPFWGVAHIGYIPKGKIVGLSKLSRVTDVFARRLQVQERLCVQISSAINDNLSPEGVGVVLQCRHSCMESRGIQKAGSVTTTSSLLGSFKEDVAVRSEFLSFVHSTFNSVNL